MVFNLHYDDSINIDYLPKTKYHLLLEASKDYSPANSAKMETCYHFDLLWLEILVETVAEAEVVFAMEIDYRRMKLMVHPEEQSCLFLKTRLLSDIINKL